MIVLAFTSKHHAILFVPRLKHKLDEAFTQIFRCVRVVKLDYWLQLSKAFLVRRIMM